VRQSQGSFQAQTQLQLQPQSTQFASRPRITWVEVYLLLSR